MTEEKAPIGARRYTLIKMWDNVIARGWFEEEVPSQCNVNSPNPCPYLRRGLFGLYFCTLDRCKKTEK